MSDHTEDVALVAYIERARFCVARIADGGCSMCPRMATPECTPEDPEMTVALADDRDRILARLSAAERVVEAGNVLDAVACNARCYNLNDVDRHEAEDASASWREARAAYDKEVSP